MAENDEENSLVDIKRYLWTPENLVTSAEMSQFWMSLTDEEKAEFRNSELPKPSEDK